MAYKTVFTVNLFYLSQSTGILPTQNAQGNFGRVLLLASSPQTKLKITRGTVQHVECVGMHS